MANNHNLPQLPADCFKSLLDQTYDGVNFVDSKRRVLYWNKGAEAITGFAAGEMIGKSCYGDDGMCHIDGNGQRLCEQLCPLLSVIKDGQKIQKRVYLRNRQGKRVPVDAVSSPVYDEGHNLLGAVQIFRDASSYEQVERESEVIARLAITDPLTGLLNRRAIEIEFEVETKRSQRLQLPMSAIFGDIDYFKAVNDSYGHPIGDQVLKNVARLLQGGIRDYDRAGRYGGEEFIVLLPETKAEIATEIAERLRRSVEGWRLIHEGKVWQFGITISFGVAEMQGAEGWERLVARADQALYRAKKSGRNLVMVA